MQQYTDGVYLIVIFAEDRVFREKKILLIVWKQQLNNLQMFMLNLIHNIMNIFLMTHR